MHRGSLVVSLICLVSLVPLVIFRSGQQDRPNRPDKRDRPALSLRSHRTRSTTPTASGTPTTPAVPRIPTADGFGLKDADPVAETLHVISWLLDTSVLHRRSRVCCRSRPGSDRPAITCEEHRSRQ